MEINDHLLDLVTLYSRNLAVPARRDVGNRTFWPVKKYSTKPAALPATGPNMLPHETRCALNNPSSLSGAYTDMLLHDMGDGLADNRPDGFASGREWRTPPLWGIGLTKTVSRHTYFLHDGRARSLLEAILWHGGEAAAARNRVIALPTTERENLLRFLNSL